jgi:hypothetical protein
MTIHFWEETSYIFFFFLTLFFFFFFNEVGGDHGPFRSPTSSVSEFLNKSN